MNKDNDINLFPLIDGLLGTSLNETCNKAQRLLIDSIKILDEAASEINSAITQLEEVDSQMDEFKVDQIYQKVYGFAGEIYARIDKSRSLDFFKKYQFYGSQFRSEFEENKDLGVVVYSFRRCCEYTFKDLTDKTITLVKPKLMNDPFDSLIMSWKENLKSFGLKDKAHLDCLSESFDYFRIRSFCANLKTKERDDSIARDILMWSHYAEEHKGICIQYRLKDKFIKSANIENGSTLFLKGIDCGSNKADVVDINDSKINANTAFFRKCNVWEYEREVRLISYNISTEENYIKEPINDDAKIEAIYFGLKCDDECKQKVASKLEGQNISFYEMKRDPQNIYNLQIDDYAIS